MSFLAPAAVLAAGLLVAASASADQGDMALPPPPPTPAVAAPTAAPPPPAPVAPAYPAPLPYAPGYAVPYVVYPAYGAGAPPPYWAPRVAATERRSNGMRTTGIVLFAAGGAITAVGVVIFGAVATTPCVNFADGSNIEPAPAPAAAREHIGSARQPLNGCDTSPTLGLGIMGAGLLTAVVGIPLFVIGSKQVPARTTTGKLAPELSVGAANASLRWVF